MIPLPFLLLGALGASLASACARPPGAPPPPPPGPTAMASPVARPATPPAARPTAPLTPGAVYTAPPPTPAQRDQAAAADACRNQADRIVAQRDRGELMREEEREARIGASTSLYDLRRPIERLSRQFYRDRLADECVQDNRREAPAPGGTPQR